MKTPQVRFREYSTQESIYPNHLILNTRVLRPCDVKWLDGSHVVTLLIIGRPYEMLRKGPCLSEP